MSGANDSDSAITCITAAAIGPPLWLLLELTYRCPLQCVFCYNPVDFAQHTARSCPRTIGCGCCVKRERSGQCNCGLSGGEPCCATTWRRSRREAHRLGFYTNLITSGVGLTEARLRALKRAGLDHIQLSFQDSTQEMNDFLSHTRTFELKQRVAKWIKAHGYPMVLNCVIHRLNIDHIG